VCRAANARDRKCAYQELLETYQQEASMDLFDKLRRGTQVFGSDNRPLGTVDRWDDQHVYIGGRPYAPAMFDHVDNDRLYFNDAGYRSYQSAGTTGTNTTAMRETDQRELRVPVAEERLEVEKRRAELGSVQVHKTVEREQVNVPVELHHEQVNVNQIDVPERLIAEGEVPDAFQEGTIRVPVRGEEAVAHKETVITGEVVIDRDIVTENDTVSDTVRRERVDVDEGYSRAREGFRQHFEDQRSGLTGTSVDTRRFEDAESNYRTGFTAAHDPRFAGRDFEDVEPEIRHQHRSTGSDQDWEYLRQEIREGFDRARR
jgi:uncharacterized protein (TIGR02271 family)